MKYRKAIIALSIVAAFVAILDAFLAFWWFGARHPDFSAVSKKVAEVPGLESGLSPQGICTLPQNDGGYTYAVSGYLSGPSRVYLVGQKEKYVTFTEGGKAITTHFGGVACTQNYLLIASGKQVIRAKLQDVYAAKDGGSVEVVDSIKTDLRSVAFCYAADGYLYAGEFYRPGNYETDASHHLDVGGETNYAFVYVYPIEEDSEGGVADMVPTKVLSIRREVQGITVTKEKIYLSCSYGLPDSKLYTYENPLEGKADREATVNGEKVPRYDLTPKRLKHTLTLPCMSEEICLNGEDLVVLFESMSKKYRYFVRTRLTDIYSIPVSRLG